MKGYFIFLGQGTTLRHVTEQMSDDSKITNYVQQKISNLQEVEKSR
jgi:hypothetical protein